MSSSSYAKSGAGQKVSQASCEERCRKRPSISGAEAKPVKRLKPLAACETSTRIDSDSRKGCVAEVKTTVEIIDPTIFGLGRYVEYHTRMLRVLDSRRSEVRDATAIETLTQLRVCDVTTSCKFSDHANNFMKSVRENGIKMLPKDVQEQLKMVTLFGNSGTPDVKDAHSMKCLFGRFDMVTFPVCADYDAGFKAIQSKDHALPCSDSFAGWFWVLHAAAPNIGENLHATDFARYKRHDGSLDEDLYLGDVENLWRNILSAMRRLEIEDGVVFPFGMGAFIRNLALLDKRYERQACMGSLRRRIASCFAKCASEACVRLGGSFRLHLCLVCIGSEDITNHNVLLEAISEYSEKCPELKDIIKLRRNVDAFDLSHRLAKDSGGHARPKVCLLNGGNRDLLGNHWFESGAVRAIDENIHRRSASMSRIALLLNDGACTRVRKENELAKRIQEFGGRVV